MAKYGIKITMEVEYKLNDNVRGNEERISED